MQYLVLPPPGVVHITLLIGVVRQRNAAPGNIHPINFQLRAHAIEGFLGLLGTNLMIFNADCAATSPE
jgi:hypothetical protein